jgi:selenocysteine-specific elongation factor
MKKRPLTDSEILSALVRKKRLKGLRQSEVRLHFHCDLSELLVLSQQLEEEGTIRILSFSPLFLVARDSLDYLCRKLVSHISQYHKKHPDEKGVTLDKIRTRFEIPNKILGLAIKTLVSTGRVREEGKAFALSGFQKVLSPREEKLLERLEEMSVQGKFHSVPLQAVQDELHLTSQALEKLLEILIERKKIVQGAGGFYLHSRWLDDIIGQVRGLGQKELTVAEFKAMTGLSRKYAIPILELLDRLGVTRRVGAGREIILKND